jgi:beta-galactosidase
MTLRTRAVAALPTPRAMCSIAMSLVAPVVALPLLLLAAADGSAVAAAASKAGVRQVVSLDGEWQFTLLAGAGGVCDTDGSNSSESCAVLQSGTIHVPGAWEAQGYGNETATMQAQVVTGQTTGAVGVYTKKLVLPAGCQVASGAKPVFMVDQGIHRHAVFKIGGKFAGEHTGYMTPFEYVLDAATAEACGHSCEVEITLDGNRACDKGGCSDALMGCMDDDIDPQGPGPWAGLNGHVSVECRPVIYIDGGVGNIMPPHVTHPPVTTYNAGKPLTLSVAILISGGAAPASVQILTSDDSTGSLVTVAKSAPSSKALSGNVTLLVTVPKIKLWSPASRSLYVAVVTLGPEGAPLDQAVTRFGVRTVTVSEGYKLMLNGHRLFLAGYGDDAIYPRTIAAPRNKSIYAEKVQFTHEHGFNFVRHHSHTLPPEYFEACDEWGIFVSPELPCAYGNFFHAGNATAQALYLASWTSYIKSYRNHPSILTWTLCNEMKMPDTFKLPGSDESFGSEVFYQVKQELDPSRLMNDQDGACTAADARDSLSFCSHQFNVGQLGCIGYNKSGSCLGGDQPTKYHDVCSTASDNHACSFKTAPKLPTISHESE